MAVNFALQKLEHLLGGDATTCVRGTDRHCKYLLHLPLDHPVTLSIISRPFAGSWKFTSRQRLCISSSFRPGRANTFLKRDAVLQSVALNHLYLGVRDEFEATAAARDAARNRRLGRHPS